MNKHLHSSLDLLRSEGLSPLSAVELIGQVALWRKLSDDKLIDTELNLHENAACPWAKSEKAIAQLVQLKEYKPAFQGFYESMKRLDKAFAGIFLLSESGSSAKVDARELWRLTESRELGSPAFSIPEQLENLLVEIANADRRNSVYCPFEASFSLALLAAEYKLTVFSEIIGESPLPFVCTLLQGKQLTVKRGHPIIRPAYTINNALQQFDIGLGILPFGTRYSEQALLSTYMPEESSTMQAETLHLRHLLAQVSKKVVTLVPPGLLFRQSAADKKLRTELVDTRWLKAIVSLPRIASSRTNIQFNIVVIDKEDRDLDVLFVDGTEISFDQFYKSRETDRNILKQKGLAKIVNEKLPSNISRIVSRNDCIKNDYDLSPSKYLHENLELVLKSRFPNESLFKLSDIASIYRAQAIKKSSLDNSYLYFDVGLHDMDSAGVIHSVKREVYVDKPDERRLDKQRLQAGDIMVSIKGRVGVIALIGQECASNWIANQSFLILRLRNTAHIKSEYLFTYLNSELVQDYFRGHTTGTTVPLLKISDIENLPICVFSFEEQKAIVESFHKVQRLSANYDDLYKQIQDEKRRYWPNKGLT